MMSLHRTSVTSRKDTMLTANTNASTCFFHSGASEHARTVMECEAENRLQALDECSDGMELYDNMGGLVVHRDANLSSQITCTSSSCARTTRRPYGTSVFNVVDVEELSPWSTTFSRVNCDQLQHLSLSGKTNRPRLNAEVICAHIHRFSLCDPSDDVSVLR